MIDSFWRDVTGFGSLILFIVFIIGSYALGEYGLAQQLFAALFLCYLIAFPIKVFFFKRRPDNQQYSNLLEKFDAASFPSVHSMRAVSLAMVLSAYANNVIFTILVIIITAGVMYTRVRLKKHFPVDVFWGTMLGGVIGYVVCYTGFLSVLFG